MAIRRLMPALLVTAAACIGAVPALVHAQAVVTCVTIDADEVCSLSLPEGAITRGVVGGGRRAGSVLFRWEATPGVAGLGSDQPDCARVGGVWGLSYYVKMYRISSGALVSTQRVCLFAGDSPADFAPPPPPTPAEVVVGQDRVMTVVPRLLPPPIGAPAVGPEGGSSIGALVQWQSVGWCDVPPSAVIDIGLRGWTAHAEMKPVKAVWRVAGPEPFSQTVTAASPGGVCGVPQTVASAMAGGAGAAFRWTPHQAGRYSVTLDITWSGTAQYAYLGQPAGDIDLGEHTYSSSVSQTVLEAQAVAISGG